MRDTTGAIILARSIIESDIFFNKPDKWFKIWCFILLIANHKDFKRFKRGECFTTYDEICSYTKATRNEVDHCMRWLKQATQITTRKATRGFYINIVNYNIYQKLSHYKSDTESDIKSELKAIQKRYRGDTINKNDKNDKNDKNEKKEIIIQAELDSSAEIKEDMSTYKKDGADLIKSFESINPACKKMYANKTQRQACDDLIETYGFDRVKTVIEKTLPKTNTIEYIPVIMTPLQLFQKWSSLEAGIIKFKSKSLKEQVKTSSKVAF